MADEELHSLDRFRKRSPKLILEHHSHGDVPVGCGGAILRWRNPFAGRCVRLWTYKAAGADESLDGVEIKERLLDLTIGKHVYALRTDSISPGGPVVLFHLEAHNQIKGSLPNEVSEKPLKIVSKVSGHWRHVAKAPKTDDWRQVGFDDSQWKPLVAIDMPEPDRRHQDSYMFSVCKRMGSAVLGPPLPWSPKSPYFIRFEFEVPAPKVIPGEE